MAGATIGWWDRNGTRILVIATIALVIATIALLKFSYDQLSDSGKILETATNSTEHLQKLVDKNNQLLEILNKAVSEIAHQTAVETYLNGQPFSLRIDDCSYDEFDKVVTYYITILDSKGNLSPIDFKIKGSHGYHPKPPYDNFSLEDVEPFHTQEELVGPGKNPTFQIPVSNILSITQNLTQSKLFITYFFSYTPFSTAKNAPITPPQNAELVHKYLIGFERNPDTLQWQKIIDDGKIPC